MPQPPSWVTLTTAPDQLTAGMWAGLLQEEDIPALVEPETFSFLGPSPYPCRVLVPQARLEEARAILEHYTGASSEGQG
ncbi:MAG: DUF2007 domain-containing protein [Chloroflexi bacterium]|nr:DUF2007 domain-containing protein [Chloroflexota bacterium]